MRFANVSITAISHYLPDKVLTSLEIEDRLEPIYTKLDFKKGRLAQLTGIKERRVCDPQVTASDLSTLAASQLLATTDIDHNDIGCLIHTGVCRDYLEPATACMVHHNLRLPPQCMVFDLSNACVGFLNGLTIAASMIELGQVKAALVVTGENSGPIYDSTINRILDSMDEELFRHSLASLTLGSAAVAYLLQPTSQVASGHSLLGGLSLADSASHDLCRGSGSHQHGLTMETKTKELMENGLMLSKQSWETFKRHLDWNNDTPDHIITHQLSSSHHKKVFQLLGLDPQKGYLDIETLGNTGSAAAPLSCALQMQKKSFRKGETIGILGIGSGLNTMMLGVRW